MNVYAHVDSLLCLINMDFVLYLFITLIYLVFNSVSSLQITNLLSLSVLYELIVFFLHAGQNTGAVNFKTIRDPAVQKGKPLPEKGTCKHYKQSHRWLRYLRRCDLSHLKQKQNASVELCVCPQVSLLWQSLPLRCVPRRGPGPPHGAGHQDDLRLLRQRAGGKGTEHYIRL